MNLGRWKVGRRAAAVASAACLASLAAAPGATGAAGSGDGPTWLWVQQAESGTFTRDSQGWKLTLTGAQDDLVAFSDRPDRLARAERLSGFLAEWDLRFGHSDPNAAIVVPSAGRRGDVLVVTLSEPTVRSRDADELVYRATVVPLGTARRLNPTDERVADTDLPRSFDDPVLFIDSGPEREDSTIYTAVKNDEDQYSLWLADRELPLGWEAVGRPGSKDEVLAWIEEVWVDMRPRSLRERMERCQETGDCR
ncbi:MAG TPA: MbtH family NRPS accessory protein [Capillimicrobium sp.]